jgi:hypothetical protein
VRRHFIFSRILLILKLNCEWADCSRICIPGGRP